MNALYADVEQIASAAASFGEQITRKMANDLGFEGHMQWAAGMV